MVGLRRGFLVVVMYRWGGAEDGVENMRGIGEREVVTGGGELVELWNRIGSGSGWLIR